MTGSALSPSTKTTKMWQIRSEPHVYIPCPTTSRLYELGLSVQSLIIPGNKSLHSLILLTFLIKTSVLLF